MLISILCALWLTLYILMSITLLITLSTDTKEYKLIKSNEAWTLYYYICQVLASSTNVYELMTQLYYWHLIIGWINSTKYLDVPYVTAPIVETMVLIGQFFPYYEIL